MNPKRMRRVEAVLQAQQGVMRTLFESSADEWLGLDFTMAQLKALFALQHSGEIPVGGLAERVRVGLPAASIMVEKLVQLGLVARREDPQDRRRTLIALTPEGE